MMDRAEKARQTRIQNQEARTAMYQEQVVTRSSARLALQRVFESPDATPAEILEAARLLAELGKY